MTADSNHELLAPREKGSPIRLLQQTAASIAPGYQSPLLLQDATGTLLSHRVDPARSHVSPSLRDYPSAFIGYIGLGTRNSLALLTLRTCIDPEHVSLTVPSMRSDHERIAALQRQLRSTQCRVWLSTLTTLPAWLFADIASPGTPPLIETGIGAATTVSLVSLWSRRLWQIQSALRKGNVTLTEDASLQPVEGQLIAGNHQEALTHLATADGIPREQEQRDFFPPKTYQLAEVISQAGEERAKGPDTLRRRICTAAADMKRILG